MDLKDNKNIHILTHLGNGDHIICNGMIRKLASSKDIKSITTYCTENNKRNIEFMFRDENKIKVKSILPTEEKALFETFQRLALRDNIFLIGYTFTDKYRYKHLHSFDETFYKQIGMQFDIRFNNFYIERDLHNETKAFDQLTSDKKEYIYVHDDSARGFNIDRNKIKSNLPEVVNCFDYNIFQMRKVLENAKEIHTMQTGMFDFCNSIDLSCPIYVHRYVRKYTNFLLSKMNKNNRYILVD